MKWKNKGHEFDEIAKIICDENNRYYIWGLGETGRYVLDLLHENVEIVVGGVDSNTSIARDGFEKIKIENPEALKKIKDKGYKIIITTFTPNEEIESILEKEGFLRNQDYFFWSLFTSVYFMYKEVKLKCFRVNIVVTEKCTLNCRDCIMNIPYIENKKHYRAEELEKNIKRLFELIDHVKEVQITGGETFLYNELDRILEFIGESYRDKISKIILLTNGTIIPKDKTLEIVKKYSMKLHISDYSKSKGFFGKQKVKEFCCILEDNNIAYEIKDETFWWKFENEIPEENVAETDLMNFYEKCPCGNFTLFQNKLYGCSRGGSKKLLVEKTEDENDFFDIMKTDLDKKELLEFCNLYTHKGYLTACRDCYGQEPITKRIIAGAIQK